MGGRKLQRKRVYEKVSILSSGPPQLPSEIKDDADPLDTNLQLDFDAANGVEDVFQGDSLSMDLDGEEVEPDSAVGEDDGYDDDEEDDDDDGNSADRLYAQEKATIAANRRKFEKEKRELLEQLPASYVESFGQVGFGKYSKKFYPVMILGPYDVPHGPPAYVRENWMETFEKVRERQR
jgi:hypothetical protein